jgi:DNA-binding MarR family transcriptional regulator
MASSDEGLTAGQLEAWIWLVVLFETMPAAIDKQLKADAGLNLFEYMVLARLSEESDRTLQMARLAEISNGSISRLSHAVTRLERRGWVDKQVGGAAQRHNTVSLTDAGYEVLATVAPPHVANVRRLLADPLTAGDIDSLVAVARKLVGAADPDAFDTIDRQVPEILARNARERRRARDERGR